jgi:hypothetical protein
MGGARLAAADSAYARMAFRDALTSGFHNLTGARDVYRDVCEKLGARVRAWCTRACVRAACGSFERWCALALSVSRARRGADAQRHSAVVH